MQSEKKVVIGCTKGDSHLIANSISAPFMLTPESNDDDVWVSWRDALAIGLQAEQVVVALQSSLPVETVVAELGLDEWASRAEAPLMHWIYALGAAALVCADGGRIVAIVDAPPPLDSADLAPEAAVSDGVAALVRSLSLSEGARGVRVNGIFTPYRLVKRPPIKPDPPLSGFPGTLAEDVTATLSLLLSPDAAYLSGHIFPADRGRSW